MRHGANAGKEKPFNADCVCSLFIFFVVKLGLLFAFFPCILLNDNSDDEISDEKYLVENWLLCWSSHSQHIQLNQQYEYRFSFFFCPSPIILFCPIGHSTAHKTETNLHSTSTLVWIIYMMCISICVWFSIERIKYARATADKNDSSSSGGGDGDHKWYINWWNE